MQQRSGNTIFYHTLIYIIRVLCREKIIIANLFIMIDKPGVIFLSPLPSLKYLLSIFGLSKIGQKYAVFLLLHMSTMRRKKKKKNSLVSLKIRKKPNS